MRGKIRSSGKKQHSEKGVSFYYLKEHLGIRRRNKEELEIGQNAKDARSRPAGCPYRG
jgi:hypothetical protein